MGGVQPELITLSFSLRPEQHLNRALSGELTLGGRLKTHLAYQTVELWVAQLVTLCLSSAFRHLFLLVFLVPRSA